MRVVRVGQGGWCRGEGRCERCVGVGGWAWVGGWAGMACARGWERGSCGHASLRPVPGSRVRRRHCRRPGGRLGRQRAHRVDRLRTPADGGRQEVGYVEVRLAAGGVADAHRLVSHLQAEAGGGGRQAWPGLHCRKSCKLRPSSLWGAQARSRCVFLQSSPVPAGLVAQLLGILVRACTPGQLRAPQARRVRALPTHLRPNVWPGQRSAP